MASYAYSFSYVLKFGLYPLSCVNVSFLNYNFFNDSIISVQTMQNIIPLLPSNILLVNDWGCYILPTLRL